MLRVNSPRERMTPEYSLNSKNTTFEGAVFLDRFHAIFGARGNVSAFRGSHQGGNAGPVKLDQEYQYVLHLRSVSFVSTQHAENPLPADICNPK